MCMLCHTFWKAGRHLGTSIYVLFDYTLYCCASFPRWGRQQLACVNSVSLYKSVRGVFIPQAAIIMVPTYTFRNDIRSPFTEAEDRRRRKAGEGGRSKRAEGRRMPKAEEGGRSKKVESRRRRKTEEAERPKKADDKRRWTTE